MEHIRKALEQAEKDRAEARTHPGAAAPGKPATAPAAPARPAVQVRYQKTRVVDVSPEVLERNRLVAALPQHPLNDAYRMLRTRVLQQLKANNWNALAITSP